MLRHAVRLASVTSLSLFGSLINFLVQATVAYRFGVGAEVDAYFYSLSVPAFVAGLLAACISYVTVPELAKVADRPDEARVLSAALLGLIIRLALVVALTGLPALLLQPALLPAHSAIRTETELSWLIIFAWLAGGGQVINGLLIARLNAVGRPMSATLLALPPGLVTIGILLLAPTLGILLATTGLLLGTISATLIGIALQRDGFAWSEIKIRMNSALPIPRSAWLSVVALSCFSTYAVIDSFWAPRAGPGVLSTLGYAQRILIGVGSLLTVGPSAIAVPYLARLVDRGDGPGFRRLMKQIVLLVTIMGGLMASAVWFWSEKIVAVLFRRGAFSGAAVHEAAAALTHLAPGMAAMLIGVMLMRAFFCLSGGYTWPAAIGLSWSVLYFFLSGLFVEQQVVGLADAYSIAWIVTILFASILLWRQSVSLDQLEGR